MSLALYRKYRPTTFEDILGIDDIVNNLKNQIETGNINHAYLFTGERGTGKTTLARVFARSLGVDPVDIEEIDAASRNGVEDMRDLSEEVKVYPFKSKYKIYILDEAHVLSKQAGAAFLKTLEEPPSHVIFILATTDPEKLLSTIVSRCQTFHLTSPNRDLLIKRLLIIATNEGFILSEENANIIVGVSNGAYRDTIGELEKVLNQARHESTTTITEEIIKKALNIIDKNIYENIVMAYLDKNNADLIKKLNELNDYNVTGYDIYINIANTLRNLLLLKLNALDENILSDKIKAYKEKINSKIMSNYLKEDFYMKSSYDDKAYLLTILIED